MRTIKSFQINSLEDTKAKLLAWARDFSEICVLDSNNHRDKHSNFEFALAAEAFTSIQTDVHQAFQDLKDYQSRANDWLFGYLTYDLKNDVENLSSENPDQLDFPELFFFQPQKLILIKDNCLVFHYLRMVDDEIDSDFQNIQNQPELHTGKTEVPTSLSPAITKADYLGNIEKLQEHIHRGDCYEANFCMNFAAENADIDPFTTFDQLNRISKAPFSAFFKNNNHFAMSASPERYVQKKGSTVLSQPIKGTAKRDKNSDRDRKIAKELQHSEKERAENTMIVDLVRNDLSKTAKKGSVQVNALCELHSFLQVHQLISSISSQITDDSDAVDLLKTTFPMGSMTGAPKVEVMKITDALESFKRGLYSGSIGYFTPEGDFDFNVVIRSILYNDHTNCLSAPVGGAITAKSDPQQEYEECLLKAKAMRRVLQ